MKSKLIRAFSFLVALIIALLIIGPALASSLFDRQETNNTPITYILAGNRYAQTFTANWTYEADSLGLYLGKLGTPATETVRIKNTSGGEPGSTTYATGSITSAMVTPGGAWITVTLSGAVTITKDTVYAIVFENAAGNSSNKFAWYGWYPTSGYAGSEPWSGNPWVDDGAFDYAFRMYGTSLDPVPLQGFTAVRIQPNLVTVNWTLPAPDTAAEIWVDDAGYPWATGTGYKIFDGPGTTVNVTLFEYVTYYFSGWGKVGSNLSSTAVDAVVTGADMTTTVSFDSNLVLLIVAMFLLFVSIFLNNPIVVIACFAAWLAVIPVINDPALDAIAGIVMVACIVRIVQIRKRGGFHV